MINQCRESKVTCSICLFVSRVGGMIRNRNFFEPSCQFCANKLLLNDAA